MRDPSALHHYVPGGTASARFLEWTRRRAGAATSIVEILRERGPDTAAEHSAAPAAWIEGVRSFYSELEPSAGPRVCTGMACHFARGRAHPSAPFTRVHCLGRCYEVPADAALPARPIPRASLCEQPVVLRHVLGAASDPLADYDLPDGAEILARVAASGLRGRGGAAYPTAAKWQVARDTRAEDRVVIANGDEGDPGAYVDRLLLEESTHAVLAGMLACARAIGARSGIVYVRAEYEQAPRRVAAAIDEAERAGLLDDFVVRVVRGAGSYVAGEETALLRSVEGLRAEPQPKPPFPAQCGLGGLPTIVQNIETLAVVPWVVRQRAQGGTKAICLSGAVARPGVVEIPLGLPLAEVLARGGGGPAPGRRWKLALVGGPMGRVVPASRFGVRLSFEELSGLGHGGVVVLDESVSARELALQLFRFAELESCGSCTPCRVGSRQLARVSDKAALERLLATLELGSLCGFGLGIPRPLRDLLEFYPEELFG